MPRLTLEDKVIIKKSSEQKYQSAFDTLDEAKSQMRAMGLEEYPKPSALPPSLSEVGDVDALTNAQLGALYVRYVAYAQFVGAKLAESVAGYKIAVSKIKHLQAELSASLFAKEVPKAEIPARIRENEMFKEFDADLVKMFAMKTLLEAHHRAYDKQAAALSRMIALRELEFQQTLRQSGIQKPKARVNDLRK